MGAGGQVNYSDLPAGAKVLDAPTANYSDLPAGAKVLDYKSPYAENFLNHRLNKALESDPEFRSKVESMSVNGAPYDPRPFGDVQDWWKEAKEHPWTAAGKAALTGLQIAPAFLGIEGIHQTELEPPINVRGPGEIPPTMVRPRAYYGGPKVEPIPSRSGLQLPGEVAPVEPSKAPTPEPEILPPLNVRRPGEVAPEMVQRRAFFGGQRAEPIPARSGLALPPGPEPAPAPAAAPVTQKAVSSAVDKAFGVEPIKQDIPLRDQVTPKAQPVSQSKAESSVIHSHNYDADAREMNVTTKTNPNVTYVYGDVDPDQAAIFDTSTSKGKAWAEFKKGGSPLVAKIVNGERIPVRPVIRAVDMNPEGARVLRNPAPTENEDLAGQLRDSLREALARRQPKSQPAPLR